MLIEEKKFNRGSSITPNPNIGASGPNEMFNSRNMVRSIAASNNNSQTEVDGSYDMQTYMNNISMNNKSK